MVRVGAVVRVLAVVRVRRGVRGGGRGRAVARMLRLMVGVLRVWRRVVVVVMMVGRGVLGHLRAVLRVVPAAAAAVVLLRLGCVVQVGGVRLVGDERRVARRGQGGLRRRRMVVVVMVALRRRLRSLAAEQGAQNGGGVVGHRGRG